MQQKIKIGRYIWPADHFHWKMYLLQKGWYLLVKCKIVKCFKLQMFHSTIISLLQEELMKVHYPKYMLQISDLFLKSKTFAW